MNLCIATASVIAVDAIGTFAPQHAKTRFDVSRDDESTRNDIIIDTIRATDGESGVTHVTNSRADFAERVCIAIPASRPHGETITLDELADARFISLVENLDESFFQMGKNTSSSGVGTGGMSAKLAAARIATSSGADMVIANGADFHIIHMILEGRELGTLFAGKKDPWFSLVDYLGRDHH